MAMATDCLGFRLNLLSVEYPDGTITSYATQRKWKMVPEPGKANPTAVIRPVLVYPLTITMEDGSQVTVNSRQNWPKSKGIVNRNLSY